MTLIFIMTSEVTAQGSRYQEVCAWTCLFFVVFFLRFSNRFSLLFSLCFSLLIFLLIWHLSHIYCFGLAYSLRQAGVLKNDNVKVDFSELSFSNFFRHLKASGVLPVCVSGLILWAYKVTVLAHTKKSTLIESVNK